MRRGEDGREREAMFEVRREGQQGRAKGRITKLTTYRERELTGEKGRERWNLDH